MPVEQIEAAKVADRWRPLLDQMRRAEQLGLDLCVALQTARHGEKRDRPFLDHVNAGLAAWNVHHDTAPVRHPWGQLGARVVPEQGPRRE